MGRSMQEGELRRGRKSPHLVRGGATAGTRAARVPQSGRAFGATQQSGRVFRECILATTRPTHIITHHIRPCPSPLQHPTHLPLRRLLPTAVTCLRPAPSRTLVAAAQSTPAQPKPVPEGQHLLSRVLHTRPTSLTQTTTNNNTFSSARPPLPSLHRLFSITLSLLSAITDS